MIRTLRMAVALLLTAVLASAVAQDETLPDAAQAALTEAQTTMQEALQTYDTQYPDRPLWQETFRHTRRAMSLAPGHPAPMRVLAEAYSRANWYGPAWRAWLDYLDAGNVLDADATPLFTEVGAEMGYNLYRAGDLEGALQTYQRIIDEVPFDLEAHTWAGRILMELGRPEAAISYWQTVAERNPNDAGASYFLELARDQADWGTAAANAFREGVAFYEEGELDRARERFARATSLNAEYAEAWAWLGRVAFDQSNYADARTYYGNASELAPDNETYRYFFQEAGRRLAPAPTADANEATPDADESGDSTEGEDGDSG